MATKQDVILKTMEYLGTPWEHQGRRKHIGVDCVGLYSCVLKELGLPVKDRTDYRRHPKPAELIAGIEAHCDEVPVADAGPGDLLLFWIKRSWLPQHIGLLIEDNHILHAPVGSKVIRRRLDKRYRERIYRAYRFKGID